MNFALSLINSDHFSESAIAFKVSDWHCVKQIKFSFGLMMAEITSVS